MRTTHERDSVEKAVAPALELDLDSRGGFLYCFLADVNHQPIAKDLTSGEYQRVGRLLGNTSIRPNSYAKYQRWGSASDPASTVIRHLCNWVFWCAVFFALGGHALATAIFGNDLSINALWPGYVSGEWHNNHHLYPTSARCGFLPHQFDLAWCVIRAAAGLGAVRRYRDHKAEF
jgi:hypothetical protein